MLRFFGAIVFAIAAALPAYAQVKPYPIGFRQQQSQTDGATLHVRVGGSARPSSCSMASATPVIYGLRWQPPLQRDHTVIVPDLRGMGLPSHPDGGYDKEPSGRHPIRHEAQHRSLRCRRA